MAAFDADWWEARCLHYGRVDTGGLPTDGAAFVAWVRWRLIDELLERFYTDFGLEPGFGLIGTELYNVALISPTCKRSPRYFGRLCGTDVHPGNDDLGFALDGLPLPPAGSPDQEILGEGVWDTWSDYLQAAIRTLGLADAGVEGHEGCFHRRGKALTPLMYRVALLIRTDGGNDWLVDDDCMLTVGGWTSSQQTKHLSAIADVVQRAGGEIPPGPPRYLAVRNEIIGWTALRTDGWVATSAGPVDAAGLWRSGATAEQIAAAISDL